MTTNEEERCNTYKDILSTTWFRLFIHARSDKNVVPWLSDKVSARYVGGPGQFPGCVILA